MRWIKKEKGYPKDGDERIITKFLLFPTCLDNETRWLEKTTIKQVARYWCDPTSASDGVHWMDKEWVNEGVTK